jgi:hypothetical protein
MILYDETTWPTDVLHYLERHHDIFLSWEQERIDQPPKIQVSGNTYDTAIYGLREILSKYNLRGFHCARLTENETAEIVNNGMTPQNGITLKERINKLQSAKIINDKIAKRLKSENQADEENRARMIWFCFFPPYKAEQEGIERFFRSWGGEALYNSHEDDNETGAVLRKIGVPCVVEAEVPISGNPHTFLETKMTRVFLKNRGLNTSECIDHEAYSSKHIPPKNILRVYRYPEKEFIDLTRSDKWNPALE